MLDECKFPHFIPDRPKGQDCFEGHSQKNLAHKIFEYIKSVDELPDKKGGVIMPRIIGLEGGWGIGKSNVVNMIEELSNKNYYTFTYDAWGHQEDLQRRSILETLTNDLIKKKVLLGKVNIKMRNGKDHQADWKDQLSLLLSNKTTTIHKSTPILTNAALWGIFVVFVFTICFSIAAQIITDEFELSRYWYIDAIPIVLAAIVFIYYRFIVGNKDAIKQMIDRKNSDTIDEQFTSSEEPSVAEFKNWLRAISDYLSTSKCSKKKLIIVFDNMDRLPSAKVMQLWSSIYTFFAGGDFENIWAIIPYDYKHLCQAIYGDKDEKEKAECIKRFIDKTFPITFNVPQPIITDYKKLLNNYFVQAFGVGQHDQEHICQVFMSLKDDPNPRTVIAFINELVSMRLQWPNKKYRLQNMALYILRKDDLFYNDKSLEANLLGDTIFKKIAPFYPHQEEVRTQLCQYAYGLEDENLAKELPLHKELMRSISNGTSIKAYSERPNFLAVLEKVLVDIDEAGLDNAVKSLVSIDDVVMPEADQIRIQAKWDMLANIKTASNYYKHAFDEILAILIRHATNIRVADMVKAYCSAMQSLPVQNGVDYYNALNDLQKFLDASNKKIDISEYLSILNSTPEHFVEYVSEAKKDYSKYFLVTDNKQLNDYLLNNIAINGHESAAVVVYYIIDDDRYNLSALCEGLSKDINNDKIKENINAAAYINRLLNKGNEILETRFTSATVKTSIDTLKVPLKNELPLGLEDVLAMYLADGSDINLNLSDDVLSRLSGCVERYMSYTDLLKHTGSAGSVFRQLNVYMIKKQKGHILDLHYAAKEILSIKDTLEIDIESIFNQFNRCPDIDWGEFSVGNDYVVNVKNYVHQSLFEDYKKYQGPFTQSIINLGVQAISYQTTGFLAKMQQVRQGYSIVNRLVVDSYWSAFVMSYLGTDYMKVAGEKLTNEATTILNHIYDSNTCEADVSLLLDKLLEYPDSLTLEKFIHNMMNNNFTKIPITILKFKYFGNLLPMLGSSMDANTARGLISNFIKPICLDPECASIIIKKKDYYIELLKLDKVLAAPLINEMVKFDSYSPIAEILKSILPEIDKKDEQVKKE